MKKLIYAVLMVAAMSMALVACKDKEDSDNHEEDDIDAITFVVADNQKA
jgi:hypothetical protein